MKHLLPLSVLTLLCFAAITILIAINSLYPQKAASVSLNKDTTVSVSIGEPILSLYGYTSPNAQVELSGNSSLNTTTQANDKGYYQFTNIFILPSSEEICLTSYDRENRSTNPVCIPAPDNNFKGSVGPVIIPPSISLTKGSFLTSETVEAKGESIPNSEITVSLFRADPTIFNLGLKIVPVAQAAALPVYTTKTDQNGYYSFNVPSSVANTFRLFTQTQYQQSPSPKSNTLTFQVLSFFEFLINQLILFLKTIFNLLGRFPLLTLIIIFESIILVYFFLRKKSNKLMVIKKDILLYGEGSKIEKTDQQIKKYRSQSV